MLETLYEKNPPEPGFRVSHRDILTIIIGFASSAILWNYVPEFAPIPALLIIHFFLFCNILRVWRWYEMAWGGIFVLNITGWAYLYGELNWPYILLCQAPITLLVAIVTITSKGYKGVGSKGNQNAVNTCQNQN
jgi:hypothetical protein